MYQGVDERMINVHYYLIFRERETEVITVQS